MNSGPYRLRAAGPATKDIENTLPEGVAAAVVEFITGTLLEDPHRLGKRLRNDLADRYSARRGAFRVIYRVDDRDRCITVLRIEHRADVYRPR